MKSIVAELVRDPYWMLSACFVSGVGGAILGNALWLATSSLLK